MKNIGLDGLSKKQSYTFSYYNFKLTPSNFVKIPFFLYNLKMNKIKEYSKGNRKIYTLKSKKFNSDFDKFFWEKVPIEEKFVAAWQLMVDAMIIKGKEERLKFKKIIKIKTIKGKIIKEINFENK